MQSENLAQLRHVVVGRLESLLQAGVLQLPKAEKMTAPMNESTTASRVSANMLESVVAAVPVAEKHPQKKSAWQPVRAASLFDAGEAPVQAGAPALTLEVIQQEVADCTRCDELARTRTQTVFGVGDPNARLCFLGEAPGADEDRTGVPFVGRGGQLLTKIIEACRMKREDVYILNMIKCRPPVNRNPLPQELSNCRGYLERQFDLIRPEFICCLGAVAAQNLLGTTVSIGKLRGKVHPYRGAKVVCTYHPAFLLRSPAFKKETWEDMKLLMREMGVEI